VLALWCASASAETMFRCVGKSGAVAYQDYPCDAKSKMTGAAEFKPEYVPRYQSPQRANQSQRQQQTASGATLHNLPVNDDECANMKAERDRQTNGKA